MYKFFSVGCCESSNHGVHLTVEKLAIKCFFNAHDSDDNNQVFSNLGRNTYLSASWYAPNNCFVSANCWNNNTTDYIFFKLVLNDKNEHN